MRGARGHRGCGVRYDATNRTVRFGADDLRRKHVGPPGGTTEIRAVRAGVERHSRAKRNDRPLFNQSRSSGSDRRADDGWLCGNDFHGRRLLRSRQTSGNVRRDRCHDSSKDNDNGSGGTTPSTTNSNVVRITVGGAAATVVVLNASPSNVPPIGGTVTMIAAVLDANGNRLRNLPVVFSADREHSGHGCEH